MSSEIWNTWNPSFHISVVAGNLTAEELVKRTLNVVYVDRDKEFSYIEWKLDNHDGELTNPEYIATGLIVRLKLGYIDGTFPWQSFIIQRIQGGVGVKGNDESGWGLAVSENEATVTFHGRNRNMAGGKRGKPWSKTAKPAPKGKQKSAPATSDVTKYDLLLDQHVTGSRKFACPTGRLSDVVEQIAQRNGFHDAYRIIEQTAAEDCIEYTMREDMTDWELLQSWADSWNWLFKIDNDTLYFHSKTYKGAKQHMVVATLDYGGGPDILSLDIDADFRLPIPREIRAAGYSYRRRTFCVGDMSAEKLNQAGNTQMGTFDNVIDGDTNIEKVLRRSYTMPSMGETKTSANATAIQQFIDRHMRAFQINVKTVGNPLLLSGRLVRLTGTGSRLVDGTWYISEAKHTMTSKTEYTTEIHLKHASKTAVAGSQIVGHYGDAYADKLNQSANHQTVIFQGVNAKEPKLRK